MKQGRKIMRIRRGGSWSALIDFCISRFRNLATSRQRINFVSFRPVCNERRGT